ncbi:MAG: hypothetical protein AB1801_16585 [Chloroflexota bacterium]
MGVLIGLIILFVGNLVAFAAPALGAAWLFTLVFPIAFNQALWLSLGTIITVEYLIQNITDIPGQSGYGPWEIIIAVVVAYVLLALSGLFGWLLTLLPVDLTLFEAIILFAISLAGGFFFLTRSGTVGFPKWMTLSEELEQADEELEDDYIAPPPRRRSRRKKKPSRQWMK